MTRTPFRPRIATALALTLASALLLAGCSSTTAPAEGGSSAAAGGAFPATLEHAYGETVIEAEPQRIVTIGWSTHDVVAALGVVPVAIPKFGWGDDKEGYLPWFEEKITELGGEQPVTLDSSEIDFEKLLELNPDLILAPYSGITEKDYERLSKIADTVAFPETAWTSDWKELTRTVGTALGRSDRAEKLITDTDASIAAQAAAHPEFAGKTFVYSLTLSEGESTMGLYGGSDPRVQIVEQLGMVSAPEIKRMDEQGEKAAWNYSLENLDQLETDVLIAWGDDEGKTLTLENPMMQQWSPVENNHALIFTDSDLVWATSAPTVLSIPWSLDKFVPMLSETVSR
ncbi:iron-siderophore ABC transporter substrate-binding protein [Mycetocola spongiae]|uniref:iron-siderophore ABC transporter substrate-binding protein n=1 Tax=Mycetocola spongiae TaxID=2859226 RepID=UPI001CF445F4|nr:iron-siderophore ABC transporter substrate-binding protein [Mycetocola spongiae]UCR89386.1 iron-siderophore ABC transporter substrate-binding protein [Mycetocola spongiae]